MPNHRKTVVSLIYTTSVINDKVTDALKPYDISPQQFNVLRILRGQKGNPANLCTIQERMVNKMSNTTRLVDKLILKKYVERNTCEENRRKVEIFITDEGLKILSEIDEIMVDVEKQLVKNLSEEEINNLNDYLEKIRD